MSLPPRPPDSVPGPGGAPARTIKLSRLLRLVPGARLDGTPSIVIGSLAYDSRQVQPGALFFALPGARTDGHRYIEEAARRGAVAVVCSKEARIPRDLPALRVDAVRTAMGDISAEFHGHPSRQLNVIGVTGTNGKTTTTFMVRSMLRAAGIPAGLLGTIHYEFGGRHLPAARTTPEAPDLQRMMAESLQGADRFMVMEVSSQGLAADRLRATRFSAAAFTNLTPDHLDAHRTMEDYFAAKKRLFEALADNPSAAPAVINVDDAYGRRLAADPVLRGGVLAIGAGPDAAVRAADIRCSERHSRFRLHSPWGETDIELSLPGRFNVFNALTAIALGGAFRIPLETMASALASMPPVPGRLERIADPAGRHLFVDYAHTEDALHNVLQTLRQTMPGRLICVFGCGGGRDPDKRPRMGAVVSALADHAIVTSDNPRNEDPNVIIREILAGMDDARTVQVEPDRAAAIRLALAAARPGDTILIAGKGHETYQEVGGRMTPFDDREVLRKALRSSIPPEKAKPSAG